MTSNPETDADSATRIVTGSAAGAMQAIPHCNQDDKLLPTPSTVPLYEQAAEDDKWHDSGMAGVSNLELPRRRRLTANASP
mmetsp:Transcript_1107/g.2285  ORF Transcript_1107/g.2285 Transcript_1107/m.2285 type:complete len:81 (-) Transcript_1107:18-260(-)